MEITSVSVNMICQNKMRMLGKNDMLIGYASLTFDNVFVCNSISIIWNLEKKKYYIRMPKHTINNRRTRDTFFAIDNNFRKKMERAVCEQMNLNVNEPIDLWSEIYFNNF